MDHMKTHWDKVPNWAKYTLYAILGIAGAFLLGLLFGNVIMWLWNWLMPSLFGLRTIGFWEGLGLLLLATIYFCKHLIRSLPCLLLAHFARSICVIAIGPTSPRI